MSGMHSTDEDYAAVLRARREGDYSILPDQIMRSQTAKKAEQVHRQNILKNLEHRLEAARTKGDESLIRQLEAEQASYQ